MARASEPPPSGTPPTPPPHPEATGSRPAANRSSSILNRTGIATRLLVAVLVPIAALAVTAFVSVRNRHTTAVRAAQIEAQIPDLNGLVRLRSLLDQERAPVELTLRASELGIRDVGLAGLFGFGGTGSTSGARAATDRELAALGTTVPASLDAALKRLRALADRRALSATAVDEAFTGLSASVADLFQVRLAALRDHTAALSQAASLNEALQTLDFANDALGAGSAEVGTLSDLWLAPPAGRLAQLSALDQSAALFDLAAEELGSATGAAGGTWRRERLQAAFVTFQDRVRTVTAGRLPPVAPVRVELPSIITTFTSGYAMSEGLYTLVDRATAAVRASAAALRASSQAAYERLLVGTIVLVAMSVALALTLAKSITRPLRRLALHARAVSAGQLAIAPIGPDGPRETAVVGEAFNDLVANLRLIEAKTKALADCDFDDAVMSQPLPGRLGQALHDSVAVLSGSIVERDALAQRLVHQATHDSLTGLHNRAAAADALQGALARANRTSEAVAVLFVDLDDFKSANDTYGHALGDEILREVASRLLATARRGDFVARLGGDEFLVVCERIDDAGEVTALGRRFVDAVCRPITLGAVQLSIGACVGVAFALDGLLDDPGQLMARADLAVYRAKHAGRKQVQLYDASLQQALLERAGVERDLSDALDRDGAGLYLEYQPVTGVLDGALDAVEALVRWNRPGYGLCQPHAFIPHAEASDLIIRLDRWVLDTALSQMTAWHEQGLHRLGLAVNISGRHVLSGRLAEHVFESLERSPIPPGRLTLELTETVLLDDLPAIASQLDVLRAAGVRIAIDDFGTGYTSLAHLQHLPVDQIKIDRSFTSQLPAGRDSSLVRMMTELGHRLGVTIVAEGVETSEQLAALRDVGCDSVQGFLIARPLPPHGISDWRDRDRASAPAGGASSPPDP